MNELTPELAAKQWAYHQECRRLSKLSNAELVWAAVGRGLVDDPLIEELCTRLDPHWAERGEMPERD